MNTRKIFGYGTIAVMLLLAFTALSLTGCENDPPTIIPQTVTYISEDSDGNLYTLVITENTGRAVYSPKNGDSFTFTVELFNNGTYSLALTYSGKVDSTEKDGTEIKITVNGEELTITVRDTIMTVISGKIVNEDDEVVVETPEELILITDKTALEKVLDAAKTAQEAVVVSADGTGVLTTAYWVTQAQMDSFTSAIAAAQAFYDAEDADQSMVKSARITLAAATNVFNEQKKLGTKTDDSGTADPELSGTISISPSTAETGTELTATYTGSETVSYQWKKDGGNVGTNSNKYTPTAAGSYTVTVSATGYQSKTSTAVTITAANQDIEGFTYALIDNGNAYRVTDYTGTSSTVVIPSIYKEKPVTEIGSTTNNSSNTSAFHNNSNITSITIPEGVTSIGRFDFFYCPNLTSVTIPSTVTVIGDWSFMYNTSLTNINIPAGVTTIGNFVFQGCTSLTNITVDSNNPNYSSENGVVYNKEKTNLILVPGGLTNITISADITSIDGYPFVGCGNLTSITVNANNPNYTSEGGILYNKSKTEIIAYPSASDSVTIPNTVTSIGKGAFYNCTNITSVTIPEGVTSIDIDAFSNCHNLISVTLPSSVTVINSATFSYCSSLTSITIPTSVTTINDTAFSYCTNLTSITIPAGVTSIQWGAFLGWTASQTINIEGHASEAAADDAWEFGTWRSDCNATINYLGG